MPTVWSDSAGAELCTWLRCREVTIILHQYFRMPMNEYSIFFRVMFCFCGEAWVKSESSVSISS